MDFYVLLTYEKPAAFEVSRELYPVVTVLLVSFQWPRAVVTVGVG